MTIRRAAIAAAVSATLTGAALCAPTHALAADTFGPTVSLTLAAGASAPASTAALHLDPLTKKADVVLAFDTTGSMWGDPNDWQLQVTQLVGQIRSLVPAARFAVTSLEDYPLPEFMYMYGTSDVCGSTSADYPFRIDSGFTTDTATINAAIAALPYSSGCDVPEAYNRAFYEVATNPGLDWDPQARRFLVVVGDTTGHDYAQHADFPDCDDAPPYPGIMTDPGGTTTTYVDGLPISTTTTPPTYDNHLVDPGPDGVFDTADDLSTKAALDDLRSAGITMLWAHYAGFHLFFPLSCHQELAAYTGGIGVDGATDITSLATFIDNASTAAATTVRSLTLRTAPASSAAWVALGTPTATTGAALSSPLVAPTDIAVPETFTVPAGTTPGVYAFDVQAIGDGVVRATQHVTITVPAPNTAPSNTTVNCDVNPTAVGQAATATTRFTDPDPNDNHTVVTNWGDGGSPTSRNLSAGSVTDSETHTYTAPGTYAVSATVTDAAGASSAVACPNWVVVYDPAAGFVTGGGSIYSAPGSYAAAPNTAGTATFGFVSKYLKGASIPTGSTQFNFDTARLSFHSDVYQWLVVSGGKAQYKGTGTLNGVDGYAFLLTATDGQAKGGDGIDAFRVKISDPHGTVVYDNRAGSGDALASANPESLTSGSIVIHG